MIFRGTTRSQQEIARLIDEMGATLSSRSGFNTLYVTALTLKDDLPRVMDVFADVILNPTFTEDEWTKLKPRRIFFIRRMADNPMTEASQFFRKNFYPKHPYGMMEIGTMKSVSAMKREDLVAFHRRYVDPRNMTLAIFGDVDLTAAEKLARKHFGSFRREGTFRPPASSAQEPIDASRAAVKVTNKEGAVVYVGFRGVTVKNLEDRARLAVLDAILSGYGYPGGWLHSELRGRGLVYEVHAFNVPGIEKGYFGIYARCRPEKAKTVAELILKHVRRMRDGKATEEELKLAKNLILTSEKLRSQTNASQAMDAAINEIYGLGYDFDDRWLERVKTVTLKDLREAATTYLTHHVLTVATPDEKSVRSLTGER